MQADFETIVKTHQEKVRNICFRFAKNRQDADDLAQDVFIQVYKSLGHFRNEAELSTWIYRIAVNKSIDFLRKKKRKKRFAQVVSIFGFGDEQGELPIIAEGNPHEDLEAIQRKEVLHQALERLPANQQKAIVLSKFEGFGNQEIADIMDLSLSAVESLIHRAKKNLRKMLYSYYEKHI